MSVQIPLEKRNIIPRWRYSHVALSTSELAIPVNQIQKKQLPKDIEEKLLYWLKYPSIEIAADIVASGFSQGFFHEAIEPAQYLIEKQKEIPSAVLHIANELAIRAGKSSIQEADNPFSKKVSDAYLRIRELKKKLQDYPRNSLMWVDLSLNYLLLGQITQSTNAMNMALAISPNNRFVLRSASRLYVHLGHPDIAHSILFRQSVTPTDPWLLAAEIAVANIAEVPPKFYKKSRELIADKKFHPFHIAELNSAIATMELYAGKNRKAKKLFESSLIKPTENSVAQSVWAKRNLPSLELHNTLISIPRTFEANAINSYLKLDWQEVVKSSSDWFLDEPFSSRPAILGSYAASVGLEDYELAKDIAQKALISNPNDHALINNQAFSLANLNKFDEALTAIRCLTRPAPNTSTEVALLATEGMIKMRSGDALQGEKFYLDAVALANKESLTFVASLASVYYAKEAFLAGILPQDEAIQFIDKVSNKISRFDMKWLIEKMRKQISESILGL